jgi:hypothetical protein
MVSKEMIFFKPNERDDKKVDLEANLLRKIDLQTLFDKVMTMPLKFRYPHMSLEEGNAKFTHGPREITVSAAGRIWIKRCNSQEDALFTLNEIEAMI